MENNQTQKNIPIGWQKIKLADIFEFKNGLNKEKKFFGEGTPIINYMDVNRGGGLYINNIAGRVEVNISELDRFNVKKGDVFFTRTSETLDEIGFSAVALDDFRNTVFSGFVLRARPKGYILMPEYAQYCFRTQKSRQEIKEKSSYTTRALTSGSLLNHVNLLLPPLPEQNRIVSILEAWGKASEKLAKKIEFKKNIKKGLMQRLLTGKLRLSGFSDKWRKESLNNLIIRQEKTNRQSGSSLDYGKYPFFNNSSKGFDQYLDVFDFDGEMLIANTGGVAYFDYYFGKFSAMSDCFVFAAKEDCRFLFYKLKMIESLINHEGFTGSGIKHLDKKFFLKIKIDVPSIEEQKAISKVLVTADKEIDTYEQKLKQLKDQKKYLLNNLITGVIRTPETMKINS